MCTPRAFPVSNCPLFASSCFPRGARVLTFYLFMHCMRARKISFPISTGGRQSAAIPRFIIDRHYRRSSNANISIHARDKISVNYAERIANHANYAIWIYLRRSPVDSLTNFRAKNVKHAAERVTLVRSSSFLLFARFKEKAGNIKENYERTEILTLQ